MHACVSIGQRTIQQVGHIAVSTVCNMISLLRFVWWSGVWSLRVCDLKIVSYDPPPHRSHCNCSTYVYCASVHTAQHGCMADVIVSKSITKPIRADSNHFAHAIYWHTRAVFGLSEFHFISFFFIFNFSFCLVRFCIWRKACGHLQTTIIRSE